MIKCDLNKAELKGDTATLLTEMTVIIQCIEAGLIDCGEAEDDDAAQLMIMNQIAHSMAITKREGGIDKVFTKIKRR